MRHLPARPLIRLGLLALIAPSLALASIDGVPDQPASPSWSVISTTGPGVVTHALVYDAGSRRALIIGGGGSGYSNGVWTLPLGDHSEWSALATAGTPPSPRRSLAAIYDSHRRRAIVFGGFDGTFLGDLWQLTLGDEPTWSRLDAKGAAPPPLAAAAAVYDSKRKRMIVIHGNDGRAPVFRNGGVWSLELTGHPRWRRLAPAGPAPAPRSAHTAVYDSNHDRVIVFGGTTPQFSDELWELRLEGHGAWHRLGTPEPRPPAREEHSAAYDAEGAELLIYGGVSIGTDYARDHIAARIDAWVLSLDGVPRWRQIASGPARWGHRAIFDPVARRMIVTGGWGPFGVKTLALPVSPAPRVAPFAAKAAPTPAAPAEIPLRLAIHAANPARGALAVRLALPSAQGARLELFDVAGRRVASRELSFLGAGLHRYVWHETSSLPAGVYLLRLSRAKEIVRTKVILLR